MKTRFLAQPANCKAGSDQELGVRDIRLVLAMLVEANAPLLSWWWLELALLVFLVGMFGDLPLPT